MPGRAWPSRCRAPPTASSSTPASRSTTPPRSSRTWPSSGISHLYTSPVLQAAPGSTHGYDVVDHSRVSDELGGADGVRAPDRCAARARHGPRARHRAEPHGHRARTTAGGGTSSPTGRRAGTRAYFDVDWSRSGTPPAAGPAGSTTAASSRPAGSGWRARRRASGLLDRRHGARPARFRLDLRQTARSPILCARRDPDAGGRRGDQRRRRDRLRPATADELEQHYRLASWRAGTRDLGYRRFFDVNELIGLRIEDEAVFADVHRLILRWVRAGCVDGLRIDHPDGLRDPAGYLARLRAAAPDAWIVVEKILAADEPLPADWPVDGTTGYGFANLATGLFVDPAGEAALIAAWARSPTPGRRGTRSSPRRAAEVAVDRCSAPTSTASPTLFARCARRTRYRDTRHELHHALREVAARRRSTAPTCRSPRCRVGRRRGRSSSGRARPPPRAAGPRSRAVRVARPGPAARGRRGRWPTELAMRFQQLTPGRHGEGRRGHGLLPTPPPRRAQRGRRRPGSVRDQRWRRSTRRWRRPPTTGRPGCSRSRRTTRSAARTSARGWRCWPRTRAGWRTPSSALARASRAAPCRRRAADRRGRLPLFQALLGAWPIDADRLAAYLPRRPARRSCAPRGPRRTRRTTPRSRRSCARSSPIPASSRGRGGRGAAARRRAPRRRSASSRSSSPPPACRTSTRAASCGSCRSSIPTTAGPVDYDRRRRLLADARVTVRGGVGAPRRGAAEAVAPAPRARPARRRAVPFRSGATARAADGPMPMPPFAFVRGEDIVTVVPRLVRRVERLGWADTAWRCPTGRGATSTAPSAGPRSRWPTCWRRSRSRSWSASP